MALPIFTITIFVSAFLLFLVQPLIGKLILPKLGGTPQVWNTCMVFFQSALLLGYAYTHSVSTRLKLRQQLVLHGVILMVPIVIMLLFPIYATVQGWSPPTEGNPIWNTFLILALIIGIPFFVVSTSAPLLQKWFGYSGHSTAKDPYFLYSASNLGSLLSLFFYPALIEPLTALPVQSYIWFGGYVVLAAFIIFCAFTIARTAPSDEQILAAEAAGALAPPAPAEVLEAQAPAPVLETATAVKSGHAPAALRGMQRKKGVKLPGRLDDVKTTDEAEPPSIAYGPQAEMTLWRRIRWVLLAAVPSSLMLGVTSYISTDLSPFPLVWVIPLALYLLSFILVYMKVWTGKRLPVSGTQGYTPHQVTLYVLQPLGILCLCYVIFMGGFSPYGATFLVMAGFFANALGCHGELAQDRPSTKHLTEYFLLMSVGGMLGGTFNGIIAPIVFQRGVLEFYIAIVVACFIRPQYVQSGWFEDFVFQIFPSFQTWLRNQGDEMAKSLGRPAPRSTYLFNYVIDILFALAVLGIAYYLRGKYYQREWLEQTFKFMGWTPYFNNNPNYPTALFDILLKLGILGPTLGLCFFFAGRPVRLGLAVLGFFVGSFYIPYLQERDDRILEARRTYFGLLRVMSGREYPNDPEERVQFTKKPIERGDRVLPALYSFTYLMHGTTYHGRNYIYDPADKHGVDLSRLATTYYHRYGPVGVVMERYNWFKGPQNTFWGDARLPATIVSDATASLGVGNLPLTTLIQANSEPPFATIGLGTGTMVSYARPFQHMAYYEIDEVVRQFSLPEEEGQVARFTYLENAIRRGVNLEVVMGDARLSLEPQRESSNIANSFVYSADFSTVLNKTRPYASAPYKNTNTTTPNRDKYYKVIVVDAFSSDAIPIHLVTKQAIKIYLDKLTDDGVLCVHTSNRHMDLVRPVARIAMDLNEAKDANGERLFPTGVYCKVGKDRADRDEGFMGLFSSEYVMLYKDKTIGDYLDKCYQDHEELYRAWKEKNDDREGRTFHAPADRPILNSRVQWYDPYVDHGYLKEVNKKVVFVKDPVTKNDSLWTDDYSYILGVLR